MTEILYTVIFKGEIAKAHAADEVRTKLASIGLISEGQLEEAFKGRPLIMKDLPREKALRFVEAFESTGALCQIEAQRHTAKPTPQGPPSQRPPQRPAQRPPLRPAERPEQPQAERPSAYQPPPTAPPNPAPSDQESITCAKCGQMQPRGTECVKCGVLFDKIETVTELANDPDKIAREIVESYRPRLRVPAVSLTPAIPHQTVANVLGPYLDPQVPWEDGEEFVINMDEELVATFDASEATRSHRTNFLLTNLKLLVFRWADGPVSAGFELRSIKQITLFGEKKNFLMVDDKTLELPMVFPENLEIREIFIKMTSEIVRALKQADRAARLQAKRAWEADPHRGVVDQRDYSGVGPRKGRLTLESFDLRDLVPAPHDGGTGGTTPTSDAPEGSGLLSGVKGLFKKK